MRWGSLGRSVAASALVVAALAVVPAGTAAAGLAALEHLTPGQHLDAHQAVPVTVVFVGLEPGSGPTGIDSLRLFAGQHRSAPVVDRTTRFAEQNGLDDVLESSRLGITYDYQYRAVFAGQVFEDAFFAYLERIALGPIPGGTIYQQAYSAHPLAAQHIGSSLLIDATATERWLADNAGPMLGVDTTRPTVFFINWFGRPDFQFHTYAFLGTRPGWSFPFGLTHNGQMTAFGGSPPDTPYGGLGRLARVWFSDLSAGPDYNNASWILDLADFNGDGITEERIPPIWEYGTSHWYRPFDDLTGDLAKVIRYVAVDELFGQAPIYDPALSEPLLADTVQLDLNLFAGVPGRDPRSVLRIPDIPTSLARLDPTRSFTTDVEVNPLAGGVDEAFRCQQSSYGPQPRSCFGNSFRPDPGNPFYDLDVYFLTHGNEYLDGFRYEVLAGRFRCARRAHRPERRHRPRFVPASERAGLELRVAVGPDAPVWVGRHRHSDARGRTPSRPLAHTRRI